MWWRFPSGTATTLRKASRWRWQKASEHGRNRLYLWNELRLNMSLQTIVRKQLFYAATGESALTSVDVREIRFEPGQQTGRHLHPCHVFGYIVEGAAQFQIEGQPARQLP